MTFDGLPALLRSDRTEIAGQAFRQFELIPFRSGCLNAASVRVPALVEGASLIHSQILGTGAYAPKRVLTNKDLESMVDTTDEWITARTGIRERRVAAEGEDTSDMAVVAARHALAMAGCRPEDIDIIIVGTISADMPLPSCAVIVQAKLGASRAFAFDLSAACAGSLFARSSSRRSVHRRRKRQARARHRRGIAQPDSSTGRDRNSWQSAVRRRGGRDGRGTDDGSGTRPAFDPSALRWNRRRHPEHSRWRQPASAVA